MEVALGLVARFPWKSEEMASNLLPMVSNLLAILLAMASILVAMASFLLAMASILVVAMASNLLKSDSLQPSSTRTHISPALQRRT